MMQFIFKNRKTNQDSKREKKLKNIELHEGTKYIPPISCCKVVKVYDGDTITIGTFLPHDKKTPYRFSVRLRHVNTPELYSKDSNETNAAVLVRDKMKEKVLGKIIFISQLTYDKYGRIFANVYTNAEDARTNNYNNSINKWPLNYKFAGFYDGKNKQTPSSWITYIQSSSFQSQSSQPLEQPQKTQNYQNSV